MAVKQSHLLALQDLIDDLKSELSGNFERVIVGMMTPTVLYDVQELRRAMKVCVPLLLQPRTSFLKKVTKTLWEWGGRSSGERFSFTDDNSKT